MAKLTQALEKQATFAQVLGLRPGRNSGKPSAAPSQSGRGRLFFALCQSGVTSRWGLCPVIP